MRREKTFVVTAEYDVSVSPNAHVLPFILYRLEDIQQRLNELNTQYEDNLQIKRALNDSAEELRLKLERAESLLTGLADERDRWELSLDQSRSNLDTIPGDSLLAAAFMTYAGPFTSAFRANFVRKHRCTGRVSETPVP